MNFIRGCLWGAAISAILWIVLLFALSSCTPYEGDPCDHLDKASMDYTGCRVFYGLDIPQG